MTRPRVAGAMMTPRLTRSGARLCACSRRRGGRGKVGLHLRDDLRMIDRLTRALARGAFVAGVLGAALSLAAQSPALAKSPARATTAAKLSPDDPAYPLTRPNPEAEIGKLPNGLTYGVMRRAGTRKVSVILMHRRRQRGRGGERARRRPLPRAHVVQRLDPLPARHGDEATSPTSASRSAATRTPRPTFDSTTFSLDVSEITPDRLDLAFSWLRDVADGSTIPQDQVDRERGVIMSEYVGSRSALGDLAEQTRSFMTPDLLGPKRAPIGLKEVIQSVNADTIRSFYHRWYRPETSIVVAVGDLPREELKARIIAAFGDWHERHPRAGQARPRPRRPEAPDLAVMVDRAGQGAADAAGLPRRGQGPRPCRKASSRAPATSRPRSGRSTLDKRLSVLANSANPPFISAEVARDEMFDAADGDLRLGHAARPGLAYRDGRHLGRDAAPVALRPHRRGIPGRREGADRAGRDRGRPGADHDRRPARPEHRLQPHRERHLLDRRGGPAHRPAGADRC